MSLSHSHSPSLTHNLSCSCTHSHSLLLARTHTHTHSSPFLLTLSYTLSFNPPLPRHTLIHTISLTLSLSPSHTPITRSAHYDPKARSMRANPFPNENPEDLAFAGDNFIRHTGIFFVSSDIFIFYVTLSCVVTYIECFFSQ